MPKIAFIFFPGIIICNDPSPDVTFSLIIVAPSLPKLYYRSLPILKIVFYNSTVLIYELLSLRSA